MGVRGSKIAMEQSKKLSGKFGFRKLILFGVYGCMFLVLALNFPRVLNLESVWMSIGGVLFTAMTIYFLFLVGPLRVELFDEEIFFLHPFLGKHTARWESFTRLTSIDSIWGESLVGVRKEGIRNFFDLPFHLFSGMVSFDNHKELLLFAVNRIQKANPRVILTPPDLVERLR